MSLSAPVRDEMLLPCPWHETAKLTPVPSGYMLGRAEELQTDTDKWAYTVRCYCGAQGPERDTEAAAIAAWNTRTPASQVEAGEVEWLRPLLETARPYVERVALGDGTMPEKVIAEAELNAIDEALARRKDQP